MAIGPIRLLALPSYRSLTNQTLIFAILDLNFSLNFDIMQAAFSPCLLYYYVCGLNRGKVAFARHGKAQQNHDVFTDSLQHFYAHQVRESGIRQLVFLNKYCTMQPAAALSPFQSLAAYEILS